MDKDYIYPLTSTDPGWPLFLEHDRTTYARLRDGSRDDPSSAVGDSALYAAVVTADDEATNALDTSTMYTPQTSIREGQSRSALVAMDKSPWTSNEELDLAGRPRWVLPNLDLLNG